MIGELRGAGAFLQVGHTGSIRTLDRRVTETRAWTVLPAVDTLGMSPRGSLEPIRWSCNTRPTHISGERDVGKGIFVGHIEIEDALRVGRRSEHQLAVAILWMQLEIGLLAINEPPPKPTGLPSSYEITFSTTDSMSRSAFTWIPNSSTK